MRIVLTILFLGIGYSSMAQSWAKMKNLPGEARHRMSGFSVGSKGYVGGGKINSGTVKSYKDWWEYDPGTDSWTQIADYGGGFRFHMSTFSIDGAGYAGGGEDNTGTYRSDYWKYVPLVNTWFPISDLPGLPRRGSTSFVIDGVPYVGLGQSGGPLNGGYELDFYLYDVGADEWFPIADFIGTARIGAVGFAYGNKGYVGTGHEVGAATRDFYEYDATTGIWTQLSDVDTTYRQDATGFQLNGKGYILTGNDVLGENDFKDVWEYDFATDTWTQHFDFYGASRRYMVTIIIDGIAYGGGGTNGTNLNDWWRFDPLYNSVDEIDATIFKLYPNPTTEKIRMNLSGLELSSSTTYKIHSVDGKLKMEDRISKGELEISCTDLHRGTYFITIYDNGQTLFTKQFILE